MSDTAQISKLEGKLVDLQSQLAFQEDTVQTLNDIVTEQQGQIERLNEMLVLLKNQIEQTRFDSGDGQAVVEERPPHY